ncbi:winged helix-turn-helix domain-containing protein [Streptomyces sp. NPDC059743]|uniref:winged helix-turn-helix domain-containing protein n=1 Tax=Streptomyces sp. NPDC059743 TaxID=3346928 RepID=UPI003646B1C4
MPTERGGGDDLPQYRSIADDLRNQILEGRLPAGQTLPKQHQLQRRYGVGRGTIQSAQQMLRDEGLLEEGAPGRAARVANRTTNLQPLAHHITRAFAARHVTLDVWSLTTEQLSKAVQNEVEAIREGRRRAPESITVRVLLPDLVTDHPYPRHVDDPADRRPLLRLRHVIRTYAGALEHSLTLLAERGLVEQVSVAIRGLPTIPGEKRYLINGTEMLTGYYSLERGQMQNNPDGASLDVLELRSDDLFASSLTAEGTSALERARFEQVVRWFESRWDQVARPLPLADEPGSSIR